MSPIERRRTLEDAFQQIDAVDKKLDGLSDRLLGFPEERYQGGAIGDLRQTVGTLSTSMARVNEQLPEMIAASMRRLQTERVAGRVVEVRRWLLLALLTPVLVAVIGTIVIALIFAATHIPGSNVSP